MLRSLSLRVILIGAKNTLGSGRREYYIRRSEETGRPEKPFHRYCYFVVFFWNSLFLFLITLSEHPHNRFVKDQLRQSSLLEGSAQ